MPRKRTTSSHSGSTVSTSQAPMTGSTWLRYFTLKYRWRLQYGSTFKALERLMDYYCGRFVHQTIPQIRISTAMDQRLETYTIDRRCQDISRNFLNLNRPFFCLFSYMPSFIINEKNVRKATRSRKRGNILWIIKVVLSRKTEYRIGFLYLLMIRFNKC